MTVQRTRGAVGFPVRGGDAGPLTGAGEPGGRKRSPVKRTGKNAPADPVGKDPGKNLSLKKRPVTKGLAEEHPAGKSSVGKPAGFASVLSIAEGRRRIEEESEEMGMAFHHLHRAGAVISLLEENAGGDLRSLLEHGISLYKKAAADDAASGKRTRCANGLLRAAEHLGMAGLYTARREYRAKVEGAILSRVQHHLDTLDPRLDGLKTQRQKEGHYLLEIARKLLLRARTSQDDTHLRYELVMAADGICTALEAGI